MTVATFSAWPSRVLSGERVGAVLPGEVDRTRSPRAFVLSTGSLSRNGLLDAVTRALGDRVVGVDAAIPAHTPQTAVLAAAERARRGGANVVVSVGGGSVIDAGKLLCAALADDLTDLAGLAEWRRAKRPTPKTPIGHIAIPTTLSGAEFTWFAGAKHPDSGLKQSFAARWLAPSAILYDPVFALETPLRLWLSTGMRAVDHAVETLLSSRSNPFSDAVCLAGLRTMLPALAAASAHPADGQARSDAQCGVWLCSAGLLAAVPMGASHAIGHVLGSLFDIPHGITSCVTLPAVIRFNGEVDPEGLSRLADVLGDDPAEGLRRRIAALGLPTGLREVGVEPKDYGRIVDGVGEEAWLRTNPRPIAGAADIERILTMAA